MGKSPWLCIDVAHVQLPTEALTITSRQQVKDLYGWDWPQSAFEPRVTVFEVKEAKVADELTLFGKGMLCQTHADGYRYWVVDAGPFRIGVFGDRARFSWEGRMRKVLNGAYGGDVDACGPFTTPELARDAAERALRELHAALGEVVEPW